MDQKSRENIIKIKEFLEDIYMYLNNNITIKSYSPDSNDKEEENSECRKHEEKRRELIENCKYIRSLFENEFHPHDVDSTISYLDMNGATKGRIKSSISDVHEIDSAKEVYVEMSQRKSANSRVSENPYNIYEAAISLNKQDSEKCPFTGLPAVHLKLMCSPIAGLLTRIERKLFFGQSKDFYAGILDKWILLYPSKSNDMAPSEYFYPKSLQNVKGANQFIIVTNHDKRYHFQAPNSQEYGEWIENINKILEEIENGRMRESQIPQLLSTRKLPSPPPQSTNDKKENDDIENYYSFGGAPQSINSNEERLYEEPCSTSIEDNESPPKLPKKTGKKIVEDEYGHEYDTPKSTKSLTESNEIEESNKESESTKNIKVIEQNEISSSTVSRVKVSEMIPILSGINLISPEEKLKSSNTIKTRKSQSIEETIPCEIVESHKRKSPVKKWFRQTIMRSKKFSQKEKSPVIEEQNENEDEEMNKVVTSVKGSKVNMIINQLEKSGQLKTLKKGLKSRKSLVYENNEEYETVCVKSQIVEMPKMKISA